MPQQSDNKPPQYDAKDIEVLSFPQAVRTRPVMYIGSTDQRALHALLACLVEGLVFHYRALQTPLDQIMWCADQLSSADRTYLHSFQSSIEYLLPGGKMLLCYHGSPRSYSERILSTTPEEELEQALAGAQGDFLVGGHTHVQMFRRFKDLLVFNPGSVGLAMDRVSPLRDIRQPAFAEYAIVECGRTSLQVALHRIAFDLQAFIQAVHASGMPHASWWASHWKEA